jgi:hypothetical protein
MTGNNKRLAVGLTIFPFLLFVTLLLAATQHDWETLATGFMSVGAAIWAGFLLSKQIQQTEAHERERLKRKYIAARATLPLALTEIIDFCEKYCGELKDFYGTNLFSQFAQIRVFQTFEIPESVMANISTMIENTPHENVAERLSEIVGMIQIFQARMRGCANGDMGSSAALRRHTIGHYMVNCGMIYAYVSSLFGYSRDKATFDKPYRLEPVRSDKVATAFMSLGMHGAQYQSVFERVTEHLNASEEVSLDKFR